MKYLGGRVILALDALLFGAFGLLYCIMPVEMGAKVGVGMASTAAVIDVQGIYGGLELGLGIFLAIGARDAARTRICLLAATCILGVIAASRALAMVRFGAPDAGVAGLVALDAVGAILNGYFLMRYRSVGE